MMIFGFLSLRIKGKLSEKTKTVVKLDFHDIECLMLATQLEKSLIRNRKDTKSKFKGMKNIDHT